MEIKRDIPLVDKILIAWGAELAADHSGYRNHVYRMINFCLAQGEFGEADRKKIVIAGCFHDLGIWSDKTFDYLPPSVKRAEDYLRENGMGDWIPEIGRMIGEHHKLRRYDGDRLTEVFRKGDLVDFSLGLFKCGLPADFVRDVKRHFPNEGFHKGLVRTGARWICRHPLNPLPVLKW
jgi:hypothetical protein